jgi:hypothetical protein
LDTSYTLQVLANVEIGQAMPFNHDQNYYCRIFRAVCGNPTPELQDLAAPWRFNGARLSNILSAQAVQNVQNTQEHISRFF